MCTLCNKYLTDINSVELHIPFHFLEAFFLIGSFPLASLVVEDRPRPALLPADVRPRLGLLILGFSTLS